MQQSCTLFGTYETNGHIGLMNLELHILETKNEFYTLMNQKSGYLHRKYSPVDLNRSDCYFPSVQKISTFQHFCV